MMDTLQPEAAGPLNNPLHAANPQPNLNALAALLAPLLQQRQAMYTTLTSTPIPEVSSVSYKISTFKIKPLTMLNTKAWKNKMKKQLQFQRCWDIIEMAQNYRKQGLDAKNLLQDRELKNQDLKVKLLIDEGLDELDQSSVMNCKTAGDVWTKLMEEYELNMESNKMEASIVIFKWRKDPKHTIMEAMKDLDRQNQELKDLGLHSIEEEILIQVFLVRLDPVYQATRDTIKVQARID